MFIRLFLIFLLTTLFFIAMPSSLLAQNDIDTKEFLAKASKAKQAGDFKTALIYMKNAVKKYPNDIPIRLELSDIYLATGLGTQAQIEINKAKLLGASLKETKARKIKSLLLQSKFKQVTAQVNTILKLPVEQIAEIRALQGQAYLSQNNLKQAKAYFFRASRLSPNEMEVQIGLARLHTIDGNRAKAKQLILEINKKHPFNVTGLLLAGNMYQYEKHYKQSLKMFEQASKIQPGSIAAWLGIVNSYIKLEKFEEANKQIQIVLDKEPDNVMANYLYAIIAYHYKDPTGALKSLRIVQKTNPEHQGALWLSGVLLYHQKRFDEAEKQLVKFLSYQPKHRQAKKILGAVYLEKKQGTLAIKILKPLLTEADADIYALLGSAYLQIGNSRKANEYLKIAEKLQPENVQIKNQSNLNKISLGKSSELIFADPLFSDFEAKGHVYIIALLNKKQYREADDLLMKYNAKSPNDTNILNLIANSYLLQEVYEASEETFKKMLTINRNSIPARMGLANLYNKQGKIKESKRQYEKIMAFEPGNLKALMSMGQLSADEKDYKRFIALMEQAIKYNNGAIEPRLVLNRYYMSIGDYNNALKLSNDLLELQPENITLLKQHADTLLAKKDISSAIRIYKKIIAINPELAIAYYWLGTVHYIWKEFDLAEANFKKSIQLGFKDIMPLVALTNIALKKGNIEVAMNKVDKLIVEFPKQFIVYELKADIYMQKRDYKSAMKLYEKALELEPSSQIAKKRYISHIKYYGIKKARKILEQWLKNNPYALELKIALAISYQEDNVYSQAIFHYEEILQKFPNHLMSINNLALLYSETNDVRSIEYAEIAYSLAPEQAETLDTLGWILLKNGRGKRALKLLKQAVAGAPANSDIRYHYAKALAVNGENKKAREQLYMIVPLEEAFESRQAAEKLLNMLKE